MSGVQLEAAPAADNTGGGLGQASELTVLRHRLVGDSGHLAA